MKKLFCRGLLFLVLLYGLPARSQISPLKAGDSVSETFWELPFEFINTPTKSGTLKNDRNKLIILDFWATWCSACLLNFPKMEALQKEFGDQIKVLAVTEQNRTVLEKFFSSKNGQKYREIPSVINDKTLSQFFPHLGIPFMIWIKDGKVISTTDAAQVTRESIFAVLQGNKNDLQTIVQLSRDRPLMLSEAFDNQKNVKLLNYAFMVKGHLPQVGGGGRFNKNKEGNVYSAQWTNLPLIDILRAVGMHLFMYKRDSQGFNQKRMIFEVSDLSALRANPDQDGVYDPNLIYSYELMVPEDKPETLFPAMLESLSRYTSYNIRMEKRNVECLILQRIPGADQPKSKGGAFKADFSIGSSEFQNAPLSVLVNMLNGKTPINLLMLDETGYRETVDLKLSDISTVERLNSELQKYGLCVSKNERTIEMMVISDASRSLQIATNPN